jgi:predicted nucleic acid-binding protein
VIAVDSSVVVAGFASWHELHEAARHELDLEPRLIAHSALEAYSVLTRLPAPHRAPAPLVRDFLADRFAEPFLHLGPPAMRELVDAFPERGIAGGAVYDALIAATAVAADAVLVSCDLRAARTYERCGARVRFLD